MSQQGDGLGQWLALPPEEAHPEVCASSRHVRPVLSCMCHLLLPLI